MNDWELTLDTKAVSDPHIGHANIVRHCNRPWNHNELIINNWRDTVQRDELIVCLGDVWMSSAARAWFPAIRDLPGRKLLIRGNHDKKSDAWFLEELGFEVIAPSIGIRWNHKGRTIALSHYPLPPASGNWSLNIHGHTHNSPYPASLRTSPRTYRNISVEVTNYTPVRLGDVIAGTVGVGPEEMGYFTDKDEHDPEREARRVSRLTERTSAA